MVISAREDIAAFIERDSRKEHLRITPISSVATVKNSKSSGSLDGLEEPE